MKKIFWSFLFVCATGVSGYLVYAMTLNKFLDPDWWKTATVEKVEKEIQNGVDVNARDKEDRTPLMFAAGYNKNPEIIKTLLAAGADVNAKDKNGTTALMKGFDKYPEIIKTLIDAGADVHAESKFGYTVLSCYLNPEILKMLLDAGAKVTAKDKDYIIGKVSLSYYNKKSADIARVVKSLVVLGLLDAKDGSGKTALLRSVDSMSFKPEMAKALLAAGADINIKDDKGKTAWDYVNVSKDSELFKAFVAAGAKLTRIGQDDFSELFNWAVMNKNPEAVKSLIADGIDVNARNKSDDKTVLMLVLSYGNSDMSLKGYSYLEKYTEIVKTLLAAGADVNAKSKGDYTALMYAASWKKGNRELVKMLIAAGADVNAKNGRGDTALMFAAQSNDNPEVAKMLIAAGADVNAKNEYGKTALMYAAQSDDNPEIVKELIAAGADIDVKDKMSETALSYAKMNKKSEIVKELVAAGAK